MTAAGAGYCPAVPKIYEQSDPLIGFARRGCTEPHASRRNLGRTNGRRGASRGVRARAILGFKSLERF
jgi:hypothetical protein